LGGQEGWVKKKKSVGASLRDLSSPKRIVGF
jgi:hypothetical protein